MFRIGIDLGGTKIELIALHATTGAECYRQRIAAPRGHYQHTLQAISHLVLEAEHALSSHADATAGSRSIMVNTVGIAIPGSLAQHRVADTMGGVSSELRIRNANSTWINGQPMQQDFSALLSRPVAMENDANCFAISEAVDGAAQGRSSVFGVIIGTGCGGGFVVNGQPFLGANGLSGEWGHNPLPFPLVYQETSVIESQANSHFDEYGVRETSSHYPHGNTIEYFTQDRALSEYPGPQCFCGKRGCIETWLSGTGFQNDYQRLYGVHSEDDRTAALSAQEIIANMRQGCPKAGEGFSRYCERLAKSLAQIVNAVDPDIIVLGGGMSNVDELYAEIPKRWMKYIFSDHCITPIVPAMHGDSSGVRGAAWLNNGISA